MGGQGQVPHDVKRVRIDESVDVIGDEAFRGCSDLLELDCHDAVTKIGVKAFFGCSSLKRVKLFGKHQNSIRHEDWTMCIF